MFKPKFIISSIIFISLLIITSAIKNKTHIIEKKISNLKTVIFVKKKDVSETQLDFYYLSSPNEIEKRINIIGFENYKPIEFSNIFFDISDLTKLNNNLSELKNFHEKKNKKK